MLDILQNFAIEVAQYTGRRDIEIDIGLPIAIYQKLYHESSKSAVYDALSDRNPNEIILFNAFGKARITSNGNR